MGGGVGGGGGSAGRKGSLASPHVCNAVLQRPTALELPEEAIALTGRRVQTRGRQAEVARVREGRAAMLAAFILRCGQWRGPDDRRIMLAGQASREPAVLRT